MASPKSVSSAVSSHLHVIWMWRNPSDYTPARPPHLQCCNILLPGAPNLLCLTHVALGNSATNFKSITQQSNSRCHPGYFAHQHLMHYATASCGMSLRMATLTLTLTCVRLRLRVNWGSSAPFRSCWNLHNSFVLPPAPAPFHPLPERDCKSSKRAHALNKINGTLSI